MDAQRSTSPFPKDSKLMKLFQWTIHNSICVPVFFFDVNPCLFGRCIPQKRCFVLCVPAAIISSSYHLSMKWPVHRYTDTLLNASGSLIEYLKRGRDWRGPCTTLRDGWIVAYCSIFLYIRLEVWVIISRYARIHAWLQWCRCDPRALKLYIIQVITVVWCCWLSHNERRDPVVTPLWQSACYSVYAVRVTADYNLAQAPCDTLSAVLLVFGADAVTTF